MSIKRPGRKVNNPCHDYFEYDEEKDVSICKIEGCNATLKGKHGTNRERHIATKHPVQILEVAAKRIKKNSSSESNASTSTSSTISTTSKNRKIKIKISKEEVMNACTELVTCNGRPFTLMEDSGFRKLLDPILKALGNLFTINAENIRHEMHTKSKEIRDEIKKEVQCKLVCVKIDTATRLDRSILGVNIQYIKDGIIVLKTLAAKELVSSHTSENICSEVTQILRLYGLSLRNIYSFTSDNAANMIKTGKLLRETDHSSLESANVYDINDNENSDVDNEDEHFNVDELDGTPNDRYFSDYIFEEDCRVMQCLRCAVHTLQLAIHDVLKIDDIRNVITKARTLCKALRVPSILVTLKRMNKNKPPLDVPTRWHSAHDMIKAVLDLKDLCNDLHSMTVARNKSQFFLSNTEWNELETIVLALEPAKIATKKLQSEQLVVGDFYCIWIRCILDTRKIESTVAEKIVSAMKKREQSLFSSEAFVAALYLDPRYSIVLNSEQVKIAKKHLKDVWIRIQALQKEHETPVNLSDNIEESDLKDDIDVYLDEHARARSQLSRSSYGDKVKDIGTLLDALESIRVCKETNILSYWEKKKRSDPELYALSCVILATPVTQVSVERLFSGLKFILNELRSNIGGPLLDDIMVVRTNAAFKTD